MTLRFRTFEDSHTNMPYQHVQITNATGARNVVASAQIDNFVIDTMQDVVTPDFKRRKAQGEIINSPMVHQITKRITGNASYYATKSGDAYRYEGSGSLTAWSKPLSGYPCTDMRGPVLLFDQAVTHEAKFKALSYLEKPSYEFGEDFRERGKTLETIRDSTGQLRKMGDKFERDFLSRMSLYRTNRVFGVKTKNRRSALRVNDKAKLLAAASDVFADVWLTARFGYGNILQSVFRSLDSMLDNVPPPNRHTVRGFASRSFPKQETFEVSLGSSAKNVFDRDFRHDADVRAYIMYEVHHPLDGFAKKHGLLLQDVPKAMWQTCPSSWVIDQFFNVSGAIQGFMGLYNPKVKVLAAGWTWETIEYDKVSLVSQPHTDGWNVSITPDVDMILINVKGREVWYPSILDLVPPFQPSGLITGPSTKIITNIAYGMKKLSLSSLLRKL